MRAFIGIPLSDEVRCSIAAACEAFRIAAPPWRDDKWVPAENLHVTLKFLGDIPQEDVEPLRLALAEACRGIEPFDLELASLKAVPNHRHATMLWVHGTEHGEVAVQCAELGEAIDRSLEPLGFETEQRAFKAHVTLCRTRRPRRVHAEALQVAGEVLAARPDSMSVRSVTLFKSTLGQGSPVYEPVAEASLGSD